MVSCCPTRSETGAITGRLTSTPFAPNGWAIAEDGKVGDGPGVKAPALTGATVSPLPEAVTVIPGLDVALVVGPVTLTTIVG